MIISFLPQFFTALLALGTIRIYTELLSPIQLGETMLLLGFLAFIDALVFSAINQTVFYFISKKEKKLTIFYIIVKYSKVLKYFYLLTFIFSIILFEFNNTFLFYLSIILLIILYFFVSPLKGSLLAILNFSEKRKSYAIQLILEAILTLMTVSVLLIFFKGWEYVLLGVLISKLIMTHTSLFILKSFLIENLSNLTIQINIKKELIDYFKYYKSIGVMGIIGWISAFADRFIIASSLGVVASGYYSIASGLVSRPYNILTATFTVHYRPTFYNSLNDNNIILFNSTQKKWLLGAVISGLLGICLFYFLGGIVCDILLAEGYRTQIQDILWVLSISLTITILTHVFENKFLASGLSEKLMKIQLYLSPFPLIFIFFGGFYFGIIGAIYGRILSDCLKLIVTYYFNRNIL